MVEWKGNKMLLGTLSSQRDNVARNLQNLLYYHHVKKGRTTREIEKTQWDNVTRNSRILLYYHHVKKGIRLVFAKMSRVSSVHYSMKMSRVSSVQQYIMKNPKMIGRVFLRGAQQPRGVNIRTMRTLSMNRRKEGEGGGEDPVPFPDCEAPKGTHLLFARALPNNGTTAVKSALQDVVLYLEAHGLPVYRLHSDKGETFNHSIRSWMRDKGIRGTWSEPGIPQGNGQAEGTVRWVKDKARTLLLASGLPTRLWPTAVEAATAQQRAQVLGWKSSLLAPYGATVHMKQKVFDSSGPRRRERAFETRWMKGKYVA